MPHSMPHGVGRVDEVVVVVGGGGTRCVCGAAIKQVFDSRTVTGFHSFGGCGGGRGWGVGGLDRLSYSLCFDCVRACAVQDCQ